MVLVLIVVPSLIAIQQDVMRYRVPETRALVTQLWGSHGVHCGGWCDRAWFAATMGVYIVTGDFISFIGAALNTPHPLGWHS